MDSAAVPSVDPPRDGRTVTSLFAVAPKWGERRKVIRITGDRESGFKSEVVKDFDKLYSQEAAALDAVASAEVDPQESLRDAWTAMASYFTSTDGEDQAAAATVLQAIAALVDPDAAAAVKCPQCQRTFATPAGLSNHMKTVHTKSGDGSTPTPPGKGK